MKIFLAFVLIFAFGVCDFAVADVLSCSAFISDRRFPSAFIPNRQELLADCPPTLAYLKCYGNEMEKDPANFDDSNRLNHENLEGLVRELCNKKSKIHKDYLSSIDCFKNVTKTFDTCLSYAKSVYRQYKLSSSDDEELIETPYDEKECLPRGHAVGCMSSEILLSCGPLEQSTYIELVTKSMYLGKFCEEDTAEYLRTNYLDYLNLDEDLRKTYQRIFEYEY